MRNSAFCICENKGADQLHGNRAADQRLCYYLNPEFQATSYLLWFMSDLVGKPKDRFSYNMAQIIFHFIITNVLIRLHKCAG